MKVAKLLLPLLLIGAALILVGRVRALADTTPWVASDKADYAPGSAVILSGGNWQAGESVHLYVNDNAGSSWSWNDTVTADPSGNITDQLTLPNWFVATYSVTATGSSGDSATTSFTDAQQLIKPGPSGSGVTFTVTFVTYTDSSCSSQTSPAHTGSVAITTDAGINVPSPGGDTAYMKITAPAHATTPSGWVFKDWNGTPTVAGDPNSICVVPPTGSTSVSYTANYGAAAVTPVLTTHVQDAANTNGTSFALATAEHDNASLSASNGTPTGTITFQLFKGGTCSNQTGTQVGSDDMKTLSSGAVNSTASGALHADSYYYLVTYTSGDTAKWNSITTPDCEDFTVNKATPTVTTQFENGSDASVSSPFALGSSLHDAATVTGSSATGFTPAGTVDFTFYGSNTVRNSNTGDCGDSTTASAGSSSLSSGTADGSNTVGPLHAGGYAFKAYYEGSSDYNATYSDCEPLTVNQGAPTVATSFQNASNTTITSPFALATSLHDHAVVGGVNAVGFAPTGTLSFTFYGSNTAGNSNTGDCADSTNASAGSGAITSSITSLDSSVEGPLHAGGYAFKASLTSTNADYANAASDCEPLTVNQATPTVATVINLQGDTNTPPTNYDKNAGTPGPDAALASVTRDVATVTGNGVTDFSPAGSVDYTFYSNGTCDAGTGNANVLTTETGVALGTASQYTSALHAGTYSYLAHYNDTSGDYNATNAPCEKLVVAKANTTTTTHVFAGTTDITNSYAYNGSPVHDTAVVTSTNTSGFSFAGTNNLVYKLYSGNCTTGTLLSTETVSYPSDSTTLSSLTPGSYCYKVQYLGNSDFNGSTAGDEPFGVAPPDAITNGSCTFDYDSSVAGRQFHLIYTPDVNNPTYFKLNASNPGQFFYNGFYIGNGGPVTVTLPYPFVTQGAVPVQIYSGFTTSTSNGQTCYTPVGSPVATSNQQITLGTYTGTFGSTAKLTFTMPSGVGFAFFTVHMDYGLKNVEGMCSVVNTADASCTSPSPSLLITNLQNYSFTDGLNGISIIQNENQFKKDPGIGGLVTQAGTNNPTAGATVSIYDSSNKQLGTATTDQDGWYMWQYKYTGKAATFVVKTGTQSQSVTMKSNGFLVVNFQT